MPRSGRPLPGMPLEMEDPDVDDRPRSKWGKNGETSGHWYWPSGRFGRVLVGIGALTVLVAFIAVLHLSKVYLQRDSRFRIAGASHIQAVGLAQVTRADLLPVFGEDIGRNIFFIPLSERRKELESIPWIQQATVMRVLPDEIRIDVVERKPVAFTRRGQQTGLVDADGVLLDMAPAAMAAHHYSFPVLTGIDPGDKPSSRQARMAVYARMMSELDVNGQHNSEQVSEIDLTDPEDARVLMPEQGTDILAHLGEDHFLERYQRYKDHIAEWRQQYPQLAAVDLRYDHQVVLEMASGVSHAQPNPGDANARPDSDSKSSAATEGPAKPKPAVKAAPEKTNKAKSAAKPSPKNTSKTKPSVSKSKSETKHNPPKSTPGKVSTPTKTAAPNQSSAQSTTKQKPSPAVRSAAAEGQ